LGLIRIGAIPMPSPNQLTARDVRYRLERSGSGAIVTDEAGAAKVEELEAPPPPRLGWGMQALGGRRDGRPDRERRMEEVGDGDPPADPTAAEDPMLFFFTSGTVSYPKMVVHAQSYTLGHIRTARFWHDLRPGDVHWTIADTGWAKAAWGS